MLPVLPVELSLDDLLKLYHDKSPENSVEYGIVLKNVSEWDRYRKYAFGRYWEHRIAACEKLTCSDIKELVTVLDWSFLRDVALGIIGDAARRNLITLEMITKLLQLIPSETYAERQLRARALLFNTFKPDENAIELLLSIRTAWALCELAVKATNESELLIIEKCFDDKRLYKSNRQNLRDVIRGKRKEISSKTNDI